MMAEPRLHRRRVPPPPQATKLAAHIRRAASVSRVILRRSRGSAHADSKSSAIKRETRSINSSSLKFSKADCCWEVAIATETPTLPLAKLALAGLMLQEAFAGRFEQLNASCPPNPPSDETVSV